MKNNKILVAETDDRMDLCAELVKFLCNGKRDRTAYTAADNGNLFDAVGFGRFAERTDEIADIFAFLFGVERLCSAADDLIDYRNRSVNAVKIGNGKGYSFAVLIDAKDNKLSRLCLLCDSGCGDHHL